MSHDNVASTAASFERFLKEVGPKLKRILAANHIPFEDAEDVLHEALLALIHQWDEIRDPESWLLGTLRRLCCLYWRNHRRRLYLAVDSTLLEWLSEPLAPPQERADLLFDLRHMIERLPRRCRSLLELRFQLGYAPAEVARRLGYSDSSIGKITNRCLAALAREMVSATAGAPPQIGLVAASSPAEVESGDTEPAAAVAAVAAVAAGRPAPASAARFLQILEPTRLPRPRRR